MMKYMLGSVIVEEVGLVDKMSDLENRALFSQKRNLSLIPFPSLPPKATYSFGKFYNQSSVPHMGVCASCNTNRKKAARLKTSRIVFDSTLYTVTALQQQQSKNRLDLTYF